MFVLPSISQDHFIDTTIDTDTVTISPELVIQDQSIGVATTAQGFNGVDGILGIGPADLTAGTVSNADTVPTITDNLFTQGSISMESIGISYEPSTGEDIANGELAFGTVDTSKWVLCPFTILSISHLF